MKANPLRRRRWLHVAVLVLLASSACTGATEPTQIGGVSALARNERIRLVNHTTQPVFAIVIGGEAAAVTDWYACVDASRCPPIEPQAERVVPYPPAYNGVRENVALVYWWHAVLGTNGVMRPDSIRHGVVPLWR